MKMRAKVMCDYGDNSVSRSVASALQPDNLPVPEGVRVTTNHCGGQVVTSVEIDGKIETLLATLDDLLSCTSTAESML